MNSETKVGIFVLAALGGLGWLATQSSIISPAGNMRDISSVFTDASGLYPGSKVKISGVNIGEVKKIRLNTAGNAVVEFMINEDVNLPAGTQTQISSDGLIGEKFISLSKPLIVDGKPIAPSLTGDNLQLSSTTAAAPENIAGNFAKISADLEAITSSLKVALGGPENAAKIAKIVEGLSSFSDDLGANGGQILSDAREATAALKNILAGNEGKAANLIANFGETAANMAKITARLERGEGTLGKLLTGDDYGAGVIEEFQLAARELRQIGTKINSGEGTLGKLVNDPATAEKLNDALDTFGEISNRLNAFKTEVDFNAFSLVGEPRVGKGQLNVTLSPRPTRYYALGVTADGFATQAEGRTDASNPFFGNEFGDELKFTAQFGHVYQNLVGNQDVGLRIGLKESTGGIGLDTRFKNVAFNRDIDVSTDLYDFSAENSGVNADNPHLDIKAKLGINRNFYGLVGYDNILNSEVSAPIIGIGVRFQDDDLKYLVGSSL